MNREMAKLVKKARNKERLSKEEAEKYVNFMMGLGNKDAWTAWIAAQANPHNIFVIYPYVKSFMVKIATRKRGEPTENHLPYENNVGFHD